MNKILETLLRFSNQIKLYHWKTQIYARHKATDKFLKTFNENLDKTIESLQGSRNIRINDDFSLKFKKMTDANSVKSVQDFRKWLIDDYPKLIKKNEPGILNIRDEMVADVNQLLFLFTLK